MSAILCEAVQRRRKRGIEFPIDFGLHAPRSLFGPIHPCCSVRVLIVHRVPVCAAWAAGWPGTARRRRRECSLPVRPSARPPIRCRRWGRRRPRIGRIITRPTQSGLSGSLSASLSLSEASPAPVHRRRVVASGSGMDGRTGERTGGSEGGSLMLQPFQKAADSLARTLGWPLDSPPSLPDLTEPKHCPDWTINHDLSWHYRDTDRFLHGC